MLKIDEITILNDGATVIADCVQYDFVRQSNTIPKQYDDCSLCAFRGAGQCNEIPCDKQEDDLMGYYILHQ